MKEEKQSRLDSFIQNPKRAIWTLAGPMMAGFMIHAMYSIVDAMFIGRLGPNALAAGTFIIALFFIAIALSNGFATGVTALVAQAIGRRDRDEADHIASNSLGLGLAIALTLSLAGLIFGERLIPMLGAEGETITFGWQYLEIICYGMPLFFVSAAIRAVLTGEGDAKTPMIIMAGATVMNLILDPILMFVLGLGIRGAALATLVSQFFALLAFIYVAFIKKHSYVRFRITKLVPRWQIIKNIGRIGIPTAMGMLVMSVAMGFINRAVSEFGQTAVAGYGAGSRVDLLVSLPVMGLAGATVSVVGMFAGAKRVDLIRKSTIYTYKWVLGLTLILGCCAYIFSYPLIGLFNKDSHVLSVGRGYLAYMVFAYPMMGIGIISGRILQGLGRGMPSLVITTVRLLVVGVPAGYIGIYVFKMPIDAIWISLISGGLIAVTISVLWVRHVVWVKDPTVRATQKIVAKPV